MNKESILSFSKEHYTELDCDEKGLEHPTPEQVHFHEATGLAHMISSSAEISYAIAPRDTPNGNLSIYFSTYLHVLLSLGLKSAHSKPISKK